LIEELRISPYLNILQEKNILCPEDKEQLSRMDVRREQARKFIKIMI
jgi:hypothetical protein